MSSYASSGGASSDQSHAFLQKPRHAADAQLEERLQGISVAFVGDHTELNCAVADRLAKSLGYVPLTTPRIIQQLTQQRQDEPCHTAIMDVCTKLIVFVRLAFANKLTCNVQFDVNLSNAGGRIMCPNFIACCIWHWGFPA